MHATIYSFSYDPKLLKKNLDIIDNHETQLLLDVDYTTDRINNEEDYNYYNIEFLNKLESFGFVVDYDEYSFIATEEGLTNYKKKFFNKIEEILYNNDKNDSDKLRDIFYLKNDHFSDNICVMIAKDGDIDDEDCDDYECTDFLIKLIIYNYFNIGTKYYLGPCLDYHF